MDVAIYYYVYIYIYSIYTRWWNRDSLYISDWIMCHGHLEKKTYIYIERERETFYIYLEPKWPCVFICFYWKGPRFEGLKPKTRGQTGSIYILYIYIFICIPTGSMGNLPTLTMKHQPFRSVNIPFPWIILWDIYIYIGFICIYIYVFFPPRLSCLRPALHDPHKNLEGPNTLVKKWSDNGPWTVWRPLGRSCFLGGSPWCPLW